MKKQTATMKTQLRVRARMESRQFSNPSSERRITARGIRVKSQVRAGKNRWGDKCKNCKNNCQSKPDSFKCLSECDLIC